MALGDYKILKETAGGVLDETTLQTEEFERIHVGTSAPADTTKLWLDTASTPGTGGGSGVHTVTKTLIAGVNSILANEFSPALTDAPITIGVVFPDPDNAGDIMFVEVGMKSYTEADNTVKIDVSEGFTDAVINVLSAASVGTSSVHEATVTLTAGVNTISAATFTPALTIAPTTIVVFYPDPDNSGDVYEVQVGMKSYVSATNAIKIEVSETFTDAVIKVI